MIRKPARLERETRAHATVGRAMEVGRAAGEAAQRGSRALGSGVLILWLVLMAFGLLTSGTPWWFKLIGLALIYGAIRLVRKHRQAVR
jgi:hypothetical protein